MLLRGKSLGRKILNRFLYGFIFAGIAALASTSLFSKSYSTEKPLITTAFADFPHSDSGGSDGANGSCDGSAAGNDCGEL